MEKMNVPDINRWTKNIAREAEREQPARSGREYTLVCGESFLNDLNIAMAIMNKRQRKQLLKQNIMNETVLQRIIAFVIGHKYYANIIRTKGLGGTVDLTSFIHPTKADALAHRRDIEQTASYSYVETISFRSRETYVKTFSPDGVRTGQQIK